MATTLMQDTTYEKSSLSFQVEAVGSGLARYGLVVIVGWIGLMKFTAYEAEGISPFVAHSPLMSWVYGFMSVRGFSAVLASGFRSLCFHDSVAQHPGRGLLRPEYFHASSGPAQPVSDRRRSGST